MGWVAHAAITDSHHGITPEISCSDGKFRLDDFGYGQLCQFIAQLLSLYADLCFFSTGSFFRTHCLSIAYNGWPFALLNTFCSLFPTFCCAMLLLHQRLMHVLFLLFE